MFQLQNVKNVNMYPRSIATNATASITADCLGWDHALVIVNAGIASSNLTTLAVSSGTASNSFSAIVAATGGTATSTSVGFVIPTADTSNGVQVAFSVDLRQRERYLKVAAENTSVATVVGGHILLTRGKVSPDTDTERGFTDVIFI